MSNTSTYLSLPYIQSGQAQKHITHNEALQILDQSVQMSVLGSRPSPDGDETEGQRVIVSDTATGEFAGYDRQIARFEGGAWIFTQPLTGWLVFDQASNTLLAYTGSIWETVGGTPSQAELFGVNASADTTNRLTVSSDASLFNHSGASHQMKINKSQVGDAASLSFQTGYSSRAELGTSWSDNFEIKVSPDGNTFHSALQIDKDTGAVTLPNSQLSAAVFGNSSLTNQNYTISRGTGAITNATGYLGNAFNYPASLSFDTSQSPNLPGSFVKTGYYSGADEMEEPIAIDPNRIYRLGAYIRQEGVAGDWSSYTQADRHQHFLGLQCYDKDGNAINAPHHARYRHGGTDSLTVLTQALSPGDTTIHVADSSGWNENDTNTDHLGIVIFGPQGNNGKPASHYSRYERGGLFDVGGVNKSTNQITLNQGLPNDMGNPDDAGGVWPVGTVVANRQSGWNYKFGFFQDLTLSTTDTWYKTTNAIGGIDLSGTNSARNFPPGTAYVRPVFLLNYTNRSGGYLDFPDTGSDHKVWITGLSLDAETNGQIVPETEGDSTLYLLDSDPTTGSVSLVQSSLKIEPI